jgi:uncharacterized membrane protein YeaQ/YmgE (transglycosylase-associated protein family)
MNLIVWLVIGGVVGWLASIIMKRDASRASSSTSWSASSAHCWRAGSFPRWSASAINSGLSIGSFLVSLLGAVVLLAIVNLFTRGRART